MASAPTSKAAPMRSNLTPSMTLNGHGNLIQSISYFPDGQRMISGSEDKTARQWDLKAGKEIEDSRSICENEVRAVAVSRDGRWVVTSTGGGDRSSAELKACEVETGNVKTFKGHSRRIRCIDISMDSKLLASGSDDQTARIWNLGTGKLVAGPFKSIDWVGAVRLSTDSKKLAVKSWLGTYIEVWDVESQKLDVRAGEYEVGGTSAPMFWTNNNNIIIAAFSFTTDDNARTIYEFDASTLKTVGAAFEGHTKDVTGLALSFDHALLASASFDNTIKLWDCESRQLLASFNVQNLLRLVLSPDSRQLAYTTITKDDCKICICDIPPDVLAQACNIARKKPSLSLQSDTTRPPPTGHRRAPISTLHMSQRPTPKTDPKQPTFLRLRKLLRFFRTNASQPSRKDQLRDPLDFPATLPLPPDGCHSLSSDKGKQKARESKQGTAQVVDVPLGQATYADVVGVDDGNRPFVLFFCLNWFQKKEKNQEPRSVYDDELEDDEEDENVLDPVSLPPPGIQHEDIELATVSQPNLGPSRLVEVALPRKTETAPI
ncbi:WD40-repeat-containing domain protein [Suillus plorans]|uniref:WD40-repeat-containing domain protein n=1 Tax=Suillus plorans TaxID=116603 RepID=A0A9P7ARG7_9AGAM|nr:WD40-repeat-containing domain protein [Suillus plorans]KAG1794681.1 WD40-repeat-containing domain protein [Suillus plorans]